MPLRQRLPLWLIAAIFLLASTAAGLTARRVFRPSNPPPCTLGELRQRLQQCSLGLHVVQNTDADEESGLYFCTTPHSREQLWGLLRAAEDAHRWKGVVFCSRDGPGAPIPEAIVDSWGEHVMRQGDLLFFGDPDLLGCIRKTVYQGRHADTGSSQ